MSRRGGDAPLQPLLLLVPGSPPARHRAGGGGWLLEGVEVSPGSIRRGAALMFYPEANVLMRPLKDPESGTPAFKRVPVLVRG